MFYNYLIKVFLSDPSLFSDVKAVVDCPLKCDPADVIKACREKVPPSEIMKMLEEPGADLERPVLRIVHKYGRAEFLKIFTRPRLNRSNRRRATIGGAAELVGRSAEAVLQRVVQEPLLPQVNLLSQASEGNRGTMANITLPMMRAQRRYSLYHSQPVDMAKLFQLNSVTADSIQSKGNEVLRIIRGEEQKRARGGDEEEKEEAEAEGAEVSLHPAESDSKRVSLADDSLLSAPSTSPAPLILAEDHPADIAIREAILSEYYSRLQRLGMNLIQLWSHFYRRVSPHWASDRNSLIPLPQPFIMPGGRFIEIYYWDSYWIILGLISSGLINEAKDAIENFLYMVERIGFIPNGSRKYYQDRSQPPFLSSMLRAYYNATGDTMFIANAFPLLEKEYQFWMNERLGHAVRLQEPNSEDDMPNSEGFPSMQSYARRQGNTHILNRFYSLEVTPRPESYRIDEITGQLYQKHNGAADSLQEHFRAIRAGAESGWDFSSRWLRPAIEGRGEEGIRPDQTVDQELHKLCLIDIDTCNVIPCDLNGIMYAFEQDLSFFAQLLGYNSLVQQYDAAAERRQKAMMLFCWDPENERWMDYDMRRRRLSKVISAASFVPLWAGVNPERLDDTRRIQLASNLSAIIRPYGVAATHVRAGLQWDSPNVWACSHHMAVDFLCGGRFWEVKKSAVTDTGPAMTLGINWASRFVNTVLDRFDLLGTCSEKYHCYRSGKSGMDGEYVTQEGFGWTNGAVLDFLEKFGTRLCPQGLYTTSNPQEIAKI